MINTNVFSFDMLSLNIMMKGRAIGSRPPTPPPTAHLPPIHLKKYDTQINSYLKSINSFLSRSNCLLQQRRYDQPQQYIQKYFRKSQTSKQMRGLIEYYRFYTNTPTLAHTKHLAFMAGYWNKKKALYYRRIKRQLQIEDQPSEGTTLQHVEQMAGKYSGSFRTGTFELPTQLHSHPIALRTDPDATIRGLLLTMSSKKHNSTRQVSKIAEFHEKSTKSHLKSHIKTNPSQLGSLSEFKKPKKRQKHKSMPNQPKSSINSKFNQKPNPYISSQKISMNVQQSVFLCNRKSKPKQGNKQSNKKRHSQAKQVPAKIHQQSKVKTKIGQKSANVVFKSMVVQKQRQACAKVKAVIDKVKGKIKAEKSEMLKKYIQSRQSCSNDSNRGLAAKRTRK